MNRHVHSMTFKLLFCGILVFLFSCQKSNRLHAQNPTANQVASTEIEDDLVPTTSFEDSDTPIVKNGVTYQAPAKKIKNPQAELLVGRVKMDKTKIFYNPSTRQLKVTGTARVLDENKNEISSTVFNISGSHDTDENRFLLKDTQNLKENSSKRPVIRAKVTCLSINSKDQYDCSRSVVDFFIAYKKQVFTEQMELIQKTKTPEDPVTPQPPPPAPAEEPLATSGDHTTAKPDDDLQEEGHEDSIEGRYQGSAETIDLKKVFEDDEDEPVVAQPPPAATPDASAKNDTPVVTPPTDPDKSQTNVDLQQPQKKEKQLTQDLQQLANGDVRQINQAIGFPNDGSLRNATSLLTKQQSLKEKAHFQVADPSRNRHFGTYEITELISRMGQDLFEISSHTLFVGNISQQKGGKVYSLQNGKIVYDKKGNPVLAHASHQIGVDVDIAYPTTSDKVKFPVVVEMKNRQYNPSSYSVEKTYALLKFTFSQSDIKVDRIFMDRTIKKALCDYAKAQNEFNTEDKDVVNTLFNNIDHVDGHGDHFHVRLKCSSYDPACRQKIYSVNKGCG